MKKKKVLILVSILLALFIDAQSANSESSCASFNGFDRSIATQNKLKSFEYFLYSHKDSLKTEYKEKILDCIVNGDLKYEYDPDMYGSSRKNYILDDFQRAILFVFDEDQDVQSAVKKRADQSLLKSNKVFMRSSVSIYLYNLYLKINEKFLLDWLQKSTFQDKITFHITICVRRGTLINYGMINLMLKRMEDLQTTTFFMSHKGFFDGRKRDLHYYLNIYSFLQNHSNKKKDIATPNGGALYQFLDFSLEKGSQSIEVQNLSLILHKSNEKDSLSGYRKVAHLFLTSIEKFESGHMISEADMQNWKYLFNTEVYTPNIYRYVNKMYGEYQKKSNNESK